MSFAITAVVVSAAGSAYTAYEQGKANDEAQAKNEANIAAMLGSIDEGAAKAEGNLDEIKRLAMGRVGEEGRVAADYRIAEEKLTGGHKRSMGHLAGAESQAQEQMQAMMEQALGGAIGGGPMAAMGGGSMGVNMARMAAGGVMQSGLPLEVSKLAASQEAQYGAQAAGLQTGKSGATARARELYLGGMQQAEHNYANLAQWQTDATVGARSGIQYQAAQVPDYFSGIGEAIGDIAGMA